MLSLTSSSLLPKSLYAMLGLVVTAAIMGGQFAVCKIGVKAGLTYQDIVALRVAFANVIAIPYGIIHARRLLLQHGIIRILIITLLSGAPYSLMFYYAISLSPTAHGAVIVPGSMALLGALLGGYFLQEKIERTRIIALITLLIGLLLMASAGLGHAGSNILLGDTLFFFVALSWASYSIIIRYYHFNSMEAAVLIMLGSLVYLPVYVLLYQPDISSWPWEQVLLQGGYHGIIHAMLAVPLFAFGVRTLGAGSASMSMAMIPMFGLLIALGFLGETPTKLQWIGIALVVGAMVGNALWAMLRAPRKQP